MHWEVLEDETLTEHQYIYFEIGKAGTGKRTVFTKPAVDWKAFRETLEITTTGMAAANYVTGTRLIMQAFRNSTKRNIKCKQDPYWWTDDIGEKRRACMKTRRELTRIRKRNVDAPAWDAALMAYRSSRKALSKLIKLSKRKCWEELCAEVDNDVWGRAYKIVMKKTGYLTPYETVEAKGNGEEERREGKGSGEMKRSVGSGVEEMEKEERGKRKRRDEEERRKRRGGDGKGSGGERKEGEGSGVEERGEEEGSGERERGRVWIRGRGKRGGPGRGGRGRGGRGRGAQTKKNFAHCIINNKRGTGKRRTGKRRTRKRSTDKKKIRTLHHK
ncbi:hypothetical protein QE152_g37626 [Popillia japonica]|uniref:Uncharacterized protein n=1 Tax=Popillia japonica TaxID=7064 RepID=A0AAW1I9X7_POPJA